MSTSFGEIIETVMSFFTRILNEIVTSPLNIGLVGAIGFVVYRIITTQMEERKVKPEEVPLPKVNYLLIILSLAFLNFFSYSFGNKI